MEFIDIKQSYLRYKEEIDTAMRKVLEGGQFIMGPEIKELEAALCNFTKAPHCITAASGTVTLEMALRALEVGPGAEVITVPFSWISSAEVIGLVGATPVFVDIEPKTYNIDLAQLESAITPRTKALIIVNLFGQMPDYTKINALAEKHNINVIEDAAQSFGASQNGKMSCNVTHVSSTSFFPAKPLGCFGDGGALFTSNPTLAARLRAIRTHGGETRHHHPYLGLNGRMDTLQAAVLLAKLPHFPKEIQLRQRVAEWYAELLKDLCQIPETAAGNTHVYAQYTIRVPKRDEIALELKKEGIPTAVYYPKCLHQQPVFSTHGYPLGYFPFAEQAANEVLSLPMHPWLTQEEQKKIASALKKALATVGETHVSLR